MRKSTLPFLLIVLGLGLRTSIAQETAKAVSLGTIKEFTTGLLQADPSAKTTYSLKVSAIREVAIQITENNYSEGSYFAFGKVVGHDQATFFVKGDPKNMAGKVILRKTKEAYDIFTNPSGEVLISPIDINKVICIDYNRYEGVNNDDFNAEVSKSNEGTLVAPILNSLPGGYGTLYLDFDGETVTGSSWGNITASPSSFTNANITTIWTAVSEDYSPFNVNVTTDIAVFNAAPPTRRMKVIFTPTDDAAPGAGGVAFLGSWGSGEPCWVFNPTVKSAEEACSHEAGHTLSLNHDGTSSQEYYAGHANWGPIMGAVYSRPIVQWSKGEYTSASNTEDDLVKISNKIPYRIDDHGNTTAAASNLNVGAGGTVTSTNNFGVIEKRTDLDVFRFTTTGGTVSFSITAKTESGSASVPDLDIQARVLDAGGAQVVLANPLGVLTTVVTISQNLAAGTYYLEIDGVGVGTPVSDYSDYGSLGQFFISGTVPGGTSTGVNEVADNQPINVFPNPSSGQFTINTLLNSGGQCSIEMMNSLGQSVMHTSEYAASGNFQKAIDVPGLAPGIYCIEIKTNDNLLRTKLVIR